MDNTTKENRRSRLTILLEILALLRYLIKNRKKESLARRTHRNTELQNLARNNKAESQLKQLLHVVYLQWAVMLERTTGADRRAVEFPKTNIRRNLEHVSTIQEELPWNTLARSYDREMNRKCVQEEEAGSFVTRPNFVKKTRNLRESNLHDAHYEARKRCLDRSKKYDETIGTLHVYKTTLLRDRDNLNRDRAIAENKIVEQLDLYNRLKEEQKSNATNVFLATVERFRLNRAAKIIQRNWRLYARRASSKKKRGRK
nr:uncharacterized protein LOC117221913 isoform X2 [Megalopta genalis]